MLEALFSGAREDAASRRKKLSLSAMTDLASEAPPVRDLTGLWPRDEILVIGEIKRRSPSRGDLSKINDPIALAGSYERGGVCAISVLTETRQFGGSLSDLRIVSGAVNVPVLRKDFLDSEFQIVESRANGADLVLLILAGLSDSLARDLLEIARSWGMDALVEAHSEDEVERAVAMNAKIIGINARDLSTFSLDKHLFGQLQHLIPEGALKVAESAVEDFQDVRRYRRDGADAVLIGEALVKGSDPEETVRKFRQS